MSEVRATSHTDIAEIPTDWDVRSLSEILTYCPRPEKVQTYTRYNLVGVRWYANGVHLHNSKLGAELQAKTVYRVNRGDVIYNRMWPTKGAFAVVDSDIGDVVATNEYPTFEPHPELDIQFLKFVMKTERFWTLASSFAKGTTGRARLHQDDFLKLPIVVPPISEQRKIATILTSLDDAITSTQRIIDATERVKRGLMQELLTKGIGHTEFKLTEIGEIPVEWDVVPLEAVISELRAGVSVNSENRTKAVGEFGVLKTSAVTYGVFEPAEHKVILAEEVSRATETPHRDHIIVSRMNTQALVGASAYVDRDYPDLFLPDRLWQLYIHSPERISCKWLSFVLGWSSMRARISEIATGTSGSMKNISKSALLSLKVALPAISEQKKVADALSSVDDKIRVERDHLAQLRTLKNSLMQVLLTGQVRVNVDCPSEVPV